jgi:hypothetical protein
VQCRFLLPVKIIASAGFEPTTLGSSGKHTDLYTTEAIKISVSFTSLVITDYSMEKIPLLSANQEISIPTCNTGEKLLEIFEFADVETSSAENCSVAQKYSTNSTPVMSSLGRRNSPQHCCYQNLPTGTYPGPAESSLHIHNQFV